MSVYTRVALAAWPLRRDPTGVPQGARIPEHPASPTEPRIVTATRPGWPGRCTFQPTAGNPPGAALFNRRSQRLWHLCRIVGLDKEDVLNQPESFTGRRLRLQIARTQSATLNHGRPYCDVKLFLPALKSVETDAELAATCGKEA
jgi:hypothetical protein